MLYATPAELAAWIDPDALPASVTLTHGPSGSTLTFTREGDVVRAVASLTLGLFTAGPWGGTVPQGFRSPGHVGNISTASGYYLLEFGVAGDNFSLACYTEPSAGVTVTTMWDTPDAQPEGTLPPPPPKATLRLRKASELVADAIAGAWYDADADDMPRDPALRRAVREATLEHAAALVAADIDPSRGPDQVTRKVASKSVLGMATSYVASSADDYLPRLAAGDTLVHAAWAILRRAGLLQRTIGSGVGGRLSIIHEQTYDPTTGALDPA